MQIKNSINEIGFEKSISIYSESEIWLMVED